MPIYYTGLNASPLFSNQDGIITSITHLTQIPFVGATDIEIGWNYFLLWRDTQLYITGKVSDNDDKNNPRLIHIPEESSGSCKIAVAGRENVIILSTRNEIWKYKVYDNSWQKVTQFISSSEQTEYVVKLSQAGGCTVVLTNLGRVFNAPLLVQIPKRIRFVDLACGYDHTILLTESGDVYSMGMGIRGQLGHDILANCDDPRLIEALAGLKVVQIAAGGWHSAAVTDQGDLYIWGWNPNGQLGITSKDKGQVYAVPTLVDFKNDRGEGVEINIKQVECGNSFTICLTDNGSFWGCGTNKYGQLGTRGLENPHNFIKLDIQPLDFKTTKRFKCHECGTAIITE